tara:strand:+ start:1413 stop:1907 length:495 start_codon:yes stop_codon:yes gene_type:complete
MNKSLFLSLFTFLTLIPSIAFAEDGSGSFWIKLLGEGIPWIVGVALVPVLLWCGKYLKRLIEEKVKYDMVKRALLKTNQVVFGVVSELSQTMADEFKAAAEDGKLTDQEKARLKSIAISKSKDLVFGETWDALKAEFGGNSGADNFLSGEIEKAVRVVNNQKKN